MRRVLLTTIALLAVAATAAVAADLPRALPARAPAYIPVGYNWTGFYLGINGGYAWGSTNCAVGACALPTRVGFHAETVRAGVNYRF
jgi:outer membrane immunogenic protein